MNRLPNKPFYSQAPIGSLEDLARVVNQSLDGLLRIARQADRSYRMVPQRKKDGSVRTTWAANRRLKAVQGFIKTRILDHVEFPRYLHGGIRDPLHRREYAKNASIHAGQSALVSEDVQDFFPSTSAARVKKIWREFFRYPEDVADCLTLLTTRRGQLPQGAKTSNHLANLAFFDDEYQLEGRLRSRGLKYSRLTDDISVSGHGLIESDDKTAIVRGVYGMFSRAGYRPKRKKHRIFTKGHAMRVHSLVVNQRAAIPKAERKAIRAEVHQLAMQYRCGELASLPEARILGRLYKLARFHPKKAARLRRQLDLSR